MPRHLADVLRRHGHKVELVPEVMSPEADDEEVFACAAEKRAIMLTCNRNDFLALAAENSHSGLIVLIRRRSALSEAGHLLELLGKAGPSGLEGNINFA